MSPLIVCAENLLTFGGCCLWFGDGRLENFPRLTDEGFFLLRGRDIAFLSTSEAIVLLPFIPVSIGDMDLVSMAESTELT